MAATGSVTTNWQSSSSTVMTTTSRCVQMVPLVVMVSFAVGHGCAPGHRVTQPDRAGWTGARSRPPATIVRICHGEALNLNPPMGLWLSA